MMDFAEMSDVQLADHLEKLRLESKQLPEKWKRNAAERMLEQVMLYNIKQVITALRRSAPFALPSGQACAACGKPVFAPTNRYVKATLVMGDKVYHGDCIPPFGMQG